MDQRVIDLYDSFTHGIIDRRAFLERLTKIAGSSAAAVALLPLLQNDYARAAMVAADDARLAIDTVSYDANGAKISGYLARLKGNEIRAAIVVVHENRGTQSAYPGHRPAAGARRLPCSRRRFAVALRRHAERRGQGA